MKWFMTVFHDGYGTFLAPALFFRLSEVKPQMRPIALVYMHVGSRLAQMISVDPC
jgi:hypothetical protein